MMNYGRYQQPYENLRVSAQEFAPYNINKNMQYGYMNQQPPPPPTPLPTLQIASDIPSFVPNNEINQASFNGINAPRMPSQFSASPEINITPKVNNHNNLGLQSNRLALNPHVGADFINREDVQDLVGINYNMVLEYYDNVMFLYKHKVVNIAIVDKFKKLYHDVDSKLNIKPVTPFDNIDDSNKTRLCLQAVNVKSTDFVAWVINGAYTKPITTMTLYWPMTLSLNQDLTKFPYMCRINDDEFCIATEGMGMVPFKTNLKAINLPVLSLPEAAHYIKVRRNILIAINLGSSFTMPEPEYKFNMSIKYKEALHAALIGLQMKNHK